MSTVDGAQSKKTGATGEHHVRNDVGFRLGLVHRTLRATWEQELADLEITPPQAAALRAVVEGEVCGLRGLARRLGSDVMNVRRLVEHLEGAGLVLTKADPGHRQRHLIRPTAEGVAVGEEIARRATARNRRVAGLLGDDDLNTLLRLLDRLQTALESTDAPAPAHAARAAGSREHERESQ
jgi:DNA-binding MarR family transcriptional regulator